MQSIRLPLIRLVRDEPRVGEALQAYVIIWVMDKKLAANVPPSSSN